MAKTNKVIENPATGTRMTTLKTERDTNNKLLQIEYWLFPYARKGSKDTHIHPNAEERLTIFSGKLNYILDRTNSPMIDELENNPF